MRFFIVLTFICSIRSGFAQENPEVVRLYSQIEALKRAELVQSMAQRSILTPDYFAERKALIARQAYDFWEEYSGDKLVSHLNVYTALHEANKYLGYDSVNGTFYNQVLGHGDLVSSIKFGNVPGLFYSAGSDGRVLEWKLSSLNSPPKVLYQGSELFRSIDISSDNQWLLAVSKENGVILINMVIRPNDPLGLEVRDLPTYTRDVTPVQSAIFMPGTSEYLSVIKSGELRLKGFKLDSLKATTDKQVRALAVSKKSKKIFAGTEEGVVQMWDREMDESYLDIPEIHRINALAISPNRKMMAIGREKGDAIIWDLENEKLLRNISGHQSAIMDLDFSPDNKLLLTASRDGTSRVFEIENTKKLPMLFDDHDDWVMTAAFNEDGSKVITGSKDGFIRVWEMNMQVLADRICEFVNRPMSPEEWKEYVGGIPYEAVCAD